MVDFTRVPGDPAPAKANDKAGAASTPMMDYRDATDLGTNTVDRREAMAASSADNVTKTQSYIAGAKLSVLGGLVTKLSAPDFTKDPSWNNQQALDSDQRIKDMRPDQEELDWLKGATSYDEYQYRWAQIPTVRAQLQQMAANPISGIAGAVVADSPSMLVPFVQEGAIGRTAATALRVAADTYDVASAVYTADQLGQSGVANALIAGTGILDMAHLVSRGFSRVAMRADDAIDHTAERTERAAAHDGNRGATNSDLNADEAGYAATTGVHPSVEPDAALAAEGKADDLVVDADNPKVPASTRDIEDDLTTHDAIPDRDVRDFGYSDLADADVNTSKALVGTKQSNAQMGAVVGADMNIQSVMARASERIDELSQVGRLPADFPPQYRTLMNAIADNAADIPVRLDRKTTFRAHFQPGSGQADAHIRLAFPKAAAGKGKMKAADVIGSMDATELRTFLHESMHAATSRLILKAEADASSVSPVVLDAMKDMDTLRAHLKASLADDVKAGNVDKDGEHYIGYYLGNNHELVAGLGDSRGGYTEFLQRHTSVTGKESALRKLGKAILRVLGVKTSERTALVDLADAIEDLLAGGAEGTGKIGKQALSRAAPEFTSDTMRGMTEAGRKAALSAPAGRAESRAADAMYGQFRQKMNRFFSLRDDIARGGADTAEFADYLVADGTRIGERQESVADLKRLMKSEMDAVTAQVEKAITDKLAEGGVGRLQQFFYRRNFVEARRELEQKVAHYLDYAHGEYRQGRPVEPPPADIKSVVDSYTGSGWGERWFDHMQNAGINNEGRFEKSPYYLPRRYSSDKLRRLSRENGFKQKDFVDIFSAAMRDAYPAMDRDLSRQVARTWHQGLTSAQPKQGAMWRRAINGLSNDEFVDMLVENGVDIVDAQAILEKSVFASERTGSNPARNLRRRNELDMQKVYTSQTGRTLRLADIMDTDVSKLMNQYNNRMSGRVAFAAKGQADMKDVANRIDVLRNTLPEDVDGWTSKVDDTIDALMGYPVSGNTPDWLLASGYLSNAMMLKNSGLYQLTDLALSAKEFGMARVVRSMFQSGLFRHARVELGKDQTLHQRLSNILSGATQNDMRFRWLHTLADDNTDLTRSAYMTNLTRNLSQAAYSANGMRAIHRATVNMNAGMIQDSIMAALGGSEKDAKLLQRFGLRSDALEQMRSAYRINPEAAFANELQTHLEVVGQRFMDYVVQQNRTGETSHFAEMNPVGRVLIGYQSFAMAGTNKILRRHIDNGEYLGLAMLMMYQFPMMALATYARYGADGKADQKSTKDLITDSVSGMSAIGGGSLVLDLFNTNQRGGGVSMLGGANSVINTLQSVAKKGALSAQDASKLVPLAQEFIPLRILINNTGD